MVQRGVGILALLAAIGAIFGIIAGIALYIFFAFSLYSLAKSRNVDMPWLAWIPIAQMYIIGKLVKSIRISNVEIPSLEIVLPVAMLAYILLNSIPVLGLIISLAFLVSLILSLYELYRQYTPENAVVYTVLSVFVIPVPILFLKLSKMEPVNNQQEY